MTIAKISNAARGFDQSLYFVLTLPVAYFFTPLPELESYSLEPNCWEPRGANKSTNDFMSTLNLTNERNVSTVLRKL